MLRILFLEFFKTRKQVLEKHINILFWSKEQYTLYVFLKYCWVMYMYLAFQCTTKNQNDPLSNFFVSHSKLNWQPISFRADTMIESLGYCMYRFTHSRFCYSLKLHPCRAIYMNTIKPDIFQNGLTLLDLTIFYTENLKQFKLRLAALGMQWNQFYSWGGQCLWILKNVLVRWDVISWVTVLWHYNEGQFIVFRSSS